MEIYKTIKNYEDYQISNYGNVKSNKLNNEKLLVQEIVYRNHTNYRRVTLSKNGKTKRFQVHRLVAEAFIENKENNPVVNHKDNNGENNNYINLEWCTHKENMEHSSKQGRLVYSQKLASIAAGIASTSRAEKREEDIIGKSFGSWIILSKSKEMNSTRRKLRCLCTRCNKEYDVDKTSIITGISKNCNSCGKEKNTLQKKEKELSNFIGKELGSWIVVDFCVFRQNKNKTKIMSYLKCNCKNCINSTVIALERVNNNIFNECVICKNK